MKKPKEGVLSKQLQKFIEQIKLEVVESKTCIDEHHLDQIILLMALAEGTSRVRF